jgi:hypothetical protein
VVPEFDLSVVGVSTGVATPSGDGSSRAGFFRFRVDSSSLGTVNDATLVFTIDAGLSVTSITGDAWTCAGDTCTLGTPLDPPASSSPEVTVQVSLPDAGGTFSVTAITPLADANATNNSATLDLSVGAVASTTTTAPTTSIVVDGTIPVTGLPTHARDQGELGFVLLLVGAACLSVATAIRLHFATRR